MNQNAFFIVKTAFSQFCQEAIEADVKSIWIGTRGIVKEPHAKITIEVTALRIVNGVSLIMIYSELFWEGFTSDSTPQWKQISARTNELLNEALNIGLSVNNGLLSLHPITVEVK